MASRREAVAQQREARLVSIRERLRGAHFGIHKVTQDNLQRVLLDSLLVADAQRARVFSITSNTFKWCYSIEDASVYRNFFARCVEGTWSVALHHGGGDIRFEFTHV